MVFESDVSMATSANDDIPAHDLRKRYPGMQIANWAWNLNTMVPEACVLGLYHQFQHRQFPRKT
jgi:hypothetical protein